MGYLKTLTSNDVIVTPFTVNKQFTSSGTTPGYSENSLFEVDGKNEPYTTGSITGSEALVYNSIKQLYYSNYLGGSDGRVSSLGTASFNPDGTIIGPRYTPNYINNIQSINDLRYFPTQSNAVITVLSIPQKLFGEYIKPGSFSSLTTYDDSEGNLRAKDTYGLPSQTNKIIGNIIYEAGIAIHTGVEGSGSSYLQFRDIQWESTITLYETQYKCTIRANEYNYSLNPSLLKSGSTDTYKDFVTGSDFSPYVTTVGLYNSNQELLAVAKLAQPLPTSQTTDTTILINIDR